jgi:hypothetical protein
VFEDAAAAERFHDEAVASVRPPDTAPRTTVLSLGDEAILYHPIGDRLLVQFREHNAVGRIVLDEHQSRVAAVEQAGRFHDRF